MQRKYYLWVCFLKKKITSGREKQKLHRKRYSMERTAVP